PYYVGSKATRGSAAGDELGNLEFRGRAAHPAYPRLAARLAQRHALLGLIGRALTALHSGSLALAPAGAAVAEAGGHHGHPHLLIELVVDHRPEDDVGVRVGGLGHRLRRAADLPQRQIWTGGD